MEEQSERFALAETAIDQLLLGKLHKGLIAPDGLKMALDDLTRRAQARGLLVGVRRPLELYQLHTSFLFNQETGILHAIIHIPMYRESHVLTLKRYIPFPFFSPGLQKFIQIEPHQIYLAQSPDNTLMKTLDEQDLNACLNIGHAYFCEDHALQKATTPSCLLQLSQGIKREDLNMCPIQILPQANTIHQISKDTYIIATSNPTSIMHACQRGQNAAQKVNPGTYTITVNPNCTTSSDQWVIYPTIQIEDANINTTTVPYDFDIPNLHDDMNEEDLKTIHSLISSIGQPVPLNQMTQLIQFRKDIQNKNAEFQIAHLFLGGGSALTTIIIIISCTAIGYFIFRCCRNRRHGHKHQHLDEHEMATMIAAPAPQAPIIIQAPAPAPAPAPAQPVAAAAPRDPVASNRPTATDRAPQSGASFYFPVTLPKGD